MPNGVLIVVTFWWFTKFRFINPNYKKESVIAVNLPHRFFISFNRSFFLGLFVHDLRSRKLCPTRPLKFGRTSPTVVEGHIYSFVDPNCGEYLSQPFQRLMLKATFNVGQTSGI